MLQFKVKVLFAQKEERELPIKDKNGVPTQLTRRYNFVTIQGLVRDPDLKIDRPVVVKSVDPEWDLPQVGSEFTTPEVRRYEIENSQPVIAV